jgi:hypothetical protein
MNSGYNTYTHRNVTRKPMYSFLNKQKYLFLFSKMENRSSLGGWYKWDGGGYEERVQEGKYGGNMYTCR